MPSSAPSPFPSPGHTHPHLPALPPTDTSRTRSGSPEAPQAGVQAPPHVWVGHPPLHSPPPLPPTSLRLLLTAHALRVFQLASGRDALLRSLCPTRLPDPPVPTPPPPQPLLPGPAIPSTASLFPLQPQRCPPKCWQEWGSCEPPPSRGQSAVQVRAGTQVTGELVLWAQQSPGWLESVRGPQVAPHLSLAGPTRTQAQMRDTHVSPQSHTGGHASNTQSSSARADRWAAWPGQDGAVDKDATRGGGGPGREQRLGRGQPASVPATWPQGRQGLCRHRRCLMAEHVGGRGAQDPPLPSIAPTSLLGMEDQHSNSSQEGWPGLSSRMGDWPLEESSRASVQEALPVYVGSGWPQALQGGAVTGHKLAHPTGRGPSCCTGMRPPIAAQCPPV